MALGSILLGLASLALGVNQLGNGLKHLGNARSAPSRKPGKQVPAGRRRLPVPEPVSTRGAKLVQKQGRQVTRTHRKGLAGEMTMSLHNVKSLDERLKYIQGRVAKGKVDPQIYALARKIVSQKCGDKWCVPEKDNVGEAKAIYEYLRKNVRYTSDILGVDSYQNPRHTLGFRAGDCDDYSITGCSLLLSVGIPCRLKVIQTKDSAEPNHIYAQAGFPRSNPTKWITMDASVAKPFGWEAPASMIAKSWLYSPT